MNTNNATAISDQMIQTEDVLYYLEQGSFYDKKGDTSKAIDCYFNGLKIARLKNDKGRIQQFTNLLLTII